MRINFQDKNLNFFNNKENDRRKISDIELEKAIG